ncbi:uncharacterized protein LOC120275627 [Dioscorea cayenensis subsp. rotundata]|uniref:Uncharacterized protein LOC120275627 n=1 Tax=Dioscorea cayennensis subsp. rotundata TaxID=55577 RepID=A0AB40CE55_DIOCR|nr:uncharacterized protein LOC120275627 [Dioscorea cayenensis subsp. rotundata]
METFSAVVRYKGEGRVLQFTVLSSWKSVMGEICAPWDVDVFEVKVKFVTPYGYKTLCPIESDADFQWATTKDGNEGLFHVAFAIIDNETNENWTWFLATLGEALYGKDSYDKIITFISDRSKGLVNAIARVFPSSPHGYCLRHLEANFMKTNSSLGKALRMQCWAVIVKIAHAYTSKEFDDAVYELACLSADTHGWLMNKSDVDHWSNYLFKGMRWCEMYSNVAESFNAWIKEARHLPVTSMVDSIRFKLMNMLAERREQCNNWDTHLCPEIQKKVEQIVDESRFLRVGYSTDDTYKVIDNNNNAVSLQPRSCSCRRWEFTVEWYRRAYVNPISPVPDSDKPSDDNRPLRLRPPISKKRLGHPRRKRIESQAFDVRELHYSRCHEACHNRRSCNAVIAD